MVPTSLVPKRTNHGRCFGVRLDAVGPGAVARRPEPDLPGLGVEPSDHLGVLRGEPRVPRPVEDHRVGIVHLRVGHREVGELSARRIQLHQPPVPVSREPDHAVRRHDQVVRMSPSLDLVALELPALRLEVGDVVPLLPHEPHPPLPVHVGIARAGALPGDGPLPDVRRGRDARGLSLHGAGGDQRERERDHAGDQLVHRSLPAGQLLAAAALGGQQVGPGPRLGTDRGPRPAAIIPLGRAARPVAVHPAGERDSWSLTGAVAQHEAQPVSLHADVRERRRLPTRRRGARDLLDTSA